MSRNPFKTIPVPESLPTTDSNVPEVLPEVTKPGKVFLNLAIGTKRMMVPSSIDFVKGGPNTSITFHDGSTVQISRYTAEQVAKLLSDLGIKMILFRCVVGPGVYFNGDPTYVNADALTGWSSNPEVVLHFRSQVAARLPGMKPADVEAALEEQFGKITYAEPRIEASEQGFRVSPIDLWTASPFTWKG